MADCQHSPPPITILILQFDPFLNDSSVGVAQLNEYKVGVARLNDCRFDCIKLFSFRHFPRQALIQLSRLFL